MSNVLDRLTNEELKHNTDKIDVQIQAEGIKELEEFSKGTFNFTSLRTELFSPVSNRRRTNLLR